MGEAKKIIFLDHDGVMCLASEWGGRFNKIRAWNKLHPDNQYVYGNEETQMDVEYRFDDFNAKAVKVLNEILLATDAEIVTSSDWKYFCTVEEMQGLFKTFGVDKGPIEYTPKLETSDFEALGENVRRGAGAERAMEIKKWLASNPQVTNWVAIDDIDMAPYLTNFVHTTKVNEGIKQSGIKEKIIAFLE